jgi:hypothetical protein
VSKGGACQSGTVVELNYTVGFNRKCKTWIEVVGNDEHMKNIVAGVQTIILLQVLFDCNSNTTKRFTEL